MKTQSSISFSSTFKHQIKQIEKEINALKAELPKHHLSKSAELDYDIKSQIIKKQNQMIELLIKQSQKGFI